MVVARGGQPSAGSAAPESVRTTERRWVRRRADLLRAGAALVLLAVLLGIALLAPASSEGLQADVESAWNRAPHPLLVLLDIVTVLTVLGVTLAVMIDSLLNRRRALAAAIAAGFTALLLAVAVGELVSAHADALQRALQFGPGSAVPSTAGIVAFLVGADLRTRHRWHRPALLALVLLFAAGLASSALSPVSGLAALLFGSAFGYLARYLLGVPAAEPAASAVVAALEAVHLRVADLRRVADEAGMTRYVAHTADRDELDIRVVDPDRRGTGLVSRLWRLVRLSAAAAGHPPLTLRGAVEREALATLVAATTGARVRRIRALTVAGSDALVVVRDKIDERPLRAVPAELVDDAVLADAWRQLRLLHTARVAHRALSGTTVALTPERRILLAGLGDAEVAAGDLLLRLDVASMLLTLGLAADPERAVRALLLAYGPVDPKSVAALLQPVALAPATRAALRGTDVLHRVRDQLRAQLADGQASPPNSTQGTTEPRIGPRLRLERFRPRTVFTVAAAVVATHVLLTQISRANPQEAIASANLWWGLVALAGSAATFVGAAICLDAFTPIRLRFWWTTVVQLASSFLKLVTPPAVGNIALNVRYLQQAGLDATTATATVALTQVGNLAATLALLVVGAVITGQAVRGPSLLPSDTVLIVIAIVLAVLAVLALVPYSRRLLLGPVLNQLRAALPRLLDMLGQPRRLLLALAGNLLLTGGFVLALDASLRAFGASAPVAEIALVYLAGSAIGSAAPTPGGLGAIEAALTAGLTAIGIPASAALPAVLLFRTATFWLPVPPGYLALTMLQRRELV
jgi:glycosyltransferase 2 family protein